MTISKAQIFEIYQKTLKWSLGAFSFIAMASHIYMFKHVNTWSDLPSKYVLILIAAAYLGVILWIINKRKVILFAFIGHFFAIGWNFGQVTEWHYLMVCFLILSIYTLGDDLNFLKIFKSK